jgi:hypothetical protein
LTVNDKLVTVSIHFLIQMLKSVWTTNCVLFYVKTKPLKIKWTVNFKELVKVTVLIANVYLSTCGSLSSVNYVMRFLSFFINKKNFGKKLCVGMCLKCLTVATPLLTAGIIREWIMPFVSFHWRVTKNGDPHYLVLHATSMTKFYLTVYYF